MTKKQTKKILFNCSPHILLFFRCPAVCFGFVHSSLEFFPEASYPSKQRRKIQLAVKTQQQLQFYGVALTPTQCSQCGPGQNTQRIDCIHVLIFSAAINKKKSRITLWYTSCFKKCYIRLWGLTLYGMRIRF